MGLPTDRLPAAQSRILGEARDYFQFHALLRARAEELNVSRLSIDDIAGLQSGYAGKLLGPRMVKGLGRLTMGPLLGALGLKLAVIEDGAAMERIQRRLTARDRSKVTAR